MKNYYYLYYVIENYMSSTIYKVVLTEKQKSLVFEILNTYDNTKGYELFCDALSNLIKGEVTKKNLLDMCDCVTLINDKFSSDFDLVIEEVSDSLYRKNVLKS